MDWLQLDVHDTDLHGTLSQQQAHVAPPTQLSQLQLLSTAEHDVLGCIHNLLVSCLCWHLQGDHTLP